MAPQAGEGGDASPATSRRDDPGPAATCPPDATIRPTLSRTAATNHALPFRAFPARCDGPPAPVLAAATGHVTSVHANATVLPYLFLSRSM